MKLKPFKRMFVGKACRKDLNKNINWLNGLKVRLFLRMAKHKCLKPEKQILCVLVYISLSVLTG